MPKNKKKKIKSVSSKSEKINYDKVKNVTSNFHIYTFGGLKETNTWLMENKYA